MRNAFAEEVAKLGNIDERVVLLSGDIGNLLFDDFKKLGKERFYNCGIAEANMMGMAAGLALSGLRPIVYTITPFTTTRCLEQIRVDVCYHNVPVIIVGTGSGLSYAQLGPTHHSCEDIAFLRALPEMIVFCPSDSVELALGLKAALSLNSPLYIRIGKKGEPVLHKEIPDFKIGKALTLKDGKDVCLLSTGTITSVALDAANYLEGLGISTRVESFHTVKPLDNKKLTDIFSNYKLVATIEEHSKIGGFFGAVAEWYSPQKNSLGQLVPFGVRDEFLHKVGTQNHARREYGLTAENIGQVMYNKFLESVGRINEKCALGTGF